MAGMSYHPACNLTDARCSQPNQASRIPDLTYPLVSSILFASSSPSLSFSFTALPSSQNRMVTHPSLFLHAMIMSWHQVQHTPSTPSTLDWLSPLNTHDYELTPECSFSFQRAFLHDRPPSACSPGEDKGTVSLWHSHGSKITNRWIEFQYPASCQSPPRSNRHRRPFAASNCISTHTLWRPRNSLNSGLPTRSITASKFAPSWPPKSISKFGELRPPSSHDHGLQSASPNTLFHDLQVRTIVATKCIFILAQSPPRSASLSSLDHVIQTHSITASQSCTIMATEVHLQTCSITASKFAQSRPPSASLSIPHHHFQAHLKLLSRTACGLSSYIVCRWVPI